MARFLVRLLVNCLAVIAAATIFPDRLEVGSPQNALVFAAVLAVLNALVKPILLLLTCPLTILTLGLFILIVNALVFWLATALPTGVRVSGFDGAFLGAVTVSIFNIVASRLERK
jgi:putative membrane protein